ncbi:MAG: monovalent cation/H(+) antiporter subunit G [Gammaproteobacteria bacterium]|nr:monovalent cation/H(+) antiporter subunit G [Gammaproteobacteria bacterium]
MLVASWLLLGLGSVFCLIGTLGLMRLPDFYSRVHAASIIDSLGAILILLGLILQTQDLLVIAKLILILLFMMLTGPTAVHALAHTALLNEKSSSTDENHQLPE